MLLALQPQDVVVFELVRAWFSGYSRSLLLLLFPFPCIVRFERLKFLLGFDEGVVAAINSDVDVNMDRHTAEA